jgi:hypothetical protein
VIQIVPQMKILVALEAVDGRKYAPSMDMRSLQKTKTLRFQLRRSEHGVLASRTPHNVVFRRIARTGGPERTTWTLLNF